MPPYLCVHLVDDLGVIDHRDLHAGRRAEVGDGGGRQAADPEERVDPAVLERVDRLGDAEPLAPHVLVAVQAGGLDHAERHHLGGAAGRAGRHALALEARHAGDAGAFDRHHVHAVGIEHHQRAHGDRRALELVLALERVERGIDHHQRDLALAGMDEPQIVDRAAGHARRRLHARARISTARSPCRRRADSRRRRCRRWRSRCSCSARRRRRRTRRPPSASAEIEMRMSCFAMIVDPPYDVGSVASSRPAAPAASIVLPAPPRRSACQMSRCSRCRGR